LQIFGDERYFPVKFVCIRLRFVGVKRSKFRSAIDTFGKCLAGIALRIFLNETGEILYIKAGSGWR